MSSTETDRTVNTDAERFIIGSVVLRGSECFSSILISKDDFALEKHRRLWHRISDMVERGQAVDYCTLADELLKHGELESVGGLGYLADLTAGLPVLDNIDAYVYIVREKAAIRRLAGVCQRGLNRALMVGEECSSIVGSLISDLQAIETSGDSIWRTPSEIISSFPSLQQFLSPAANGNQIGIAFPWPTIQNVTCGMQSGELIIVAGRPSSGKTVVGLQAALTPAMKGEGVAYVSLEMRDAALIRRAIAGLAQVDSARMKRGLLSADERKRVTDIW
jgi:replicative DNA helicase